MIAPPIGSRNHRATLALLRAALGVPPLAGDGEDVRLADPHQIMAIATSHRILESLAPGVAAGRPLREELEPNAVVFLEELHAANARRNARLTETLRHLGSVFAAQSWEAVVLKGGADLALGNEIPGRFVGDLDLLMPEQNAREAQQLLVSAGWDEYVEPDRFVETHHHMPPLSHRQHEGFVEIHLRIGTPAVETALPASLVVAHSVPSGHKGLRVPCRDHRVAHLALHAQFGDFRWEEGRISLCQVADLSRLKALGLVAPVSESEPDETTDAIDAFHLASALLLGQSTKKITASASAHRWAKRALQNLSRPSEVRKARALRALRWRVHALVFDPTQRAHWAKNLLTASGLKRSIDKLRRKLTEIR